MFLKNDSNFQCGLRTKKEVLTIKPGEVVHVFDADIISLNSKLVQVTEEEAEAIIKPTSNQTPNKPVVKKQDSEEGEQAKEGEGQDNGQGENKKDEPETLESLENKLEELKTKWEQTSRPNKKEAIQKQIKEVQEKIDKLK